MVKLIAFIIATTVFVSNLSMMFPGFFSAKSTPVVCTYPAEIVSERGAEFSVDIKIINVTNLYSWEVILSWDKEILEAKTATEGPFLSQGGQYQTYFVKKIYNDKGYLRLDCTILGGDPTTHADGTGTLATITFFVKACGASFLHFNQTLLLTYDLNEIPHSSIDGLFYTNCPAAKFTYFPVNPAPGKLITFNASLSYDYATGNITTYTWNFDDGNISAVSTPIIKHAYHSPGVYNVSLTVTNSLGLSCQTFHLIEVIKLYTDVDGNNKVDYRDLFTFAASYETYFGDSRYNPSCDFNSDDRIDDQDLSILAAEYGKKVDP